MTKFEEFDYKRPEIDHFQPAFEAALARFKESKTLDIQAAAFEEMNVLRRDFSTMYNLCYVRHTSDTKNKFYEDENTYFDEKLPAFEALSTLYYAALLDSPFRADLEKQYGDYLFVVAELALKTFRPTILDDLGKENALTSEYTKIKAQAKIKFDKETYNLSSIHAIELSDDRSIRRRAAKAKWRFYTKKAPQMERIYDDMVQARHRMAVELGYKNFVDMGYARMRRSDYTPEMVANFRKQVQELIVPIASSLYERQRKRLGLRALKFYDEDYKFKTGNPKPIGTPEEIVGNATKMYDELSTETSDFFRYMQDKNLMDLVNRDGKATGGYCTYINDYEAPFIFSNFNGTSGDIDVLTHEAGHAFQVFSSRTLPLDEYYWPTSDAAEIHSMSMEFFTWPWMENFFGDQTEKYRFMHLAGAVCFLPYGVAVDEFQHIVYENPSMTPAERNAAWSALEKKYLPHRDYAGVKYLENGGFWQKQSHIFTSPFYYIDYTLAQICAFQFWTKDRQDHKSAWEDYLRLCKAGGSQSFLGLVELANLRSPFENGCVESVVGDIKAFLERVDDKEF